VPLKINSFVYLRKVSLKIIWLRGIGKEAPSVVFVVNMRRFNTFFYRVIAMQVWGTVSRIFGIKKPRSISDIFGAWIKSFSAKQRKHVLLRTATVCWAIWLSRNNAGFQRSKPCSCLHVIFKSAFWIRSWSILIKEEEQRCLLLGSHCLETTTLEIFNNFGWNSLRRITN
jgi:hypothetical protein